MVFLSFMDPLQMGKMKLKPEQGRDWPLVGRTSQTLGLDIEAQPEAQPSSVRGDVCYKYTKPVISSLMTIYLVFCKSKAKYLGLCRQWLAQHQAGSNASRLQGAEESREGWLQSTGFGYTVH